MTWATPLVASALACTTLAMSVLAPPWKVTPDFCTKAVTLEPSTVLIFIPLV